VIGFATGRTVLLVAVTCGGPGTLIAIGRGPQAAGAPAAFPDQAAAPVDRAQLMADVSTLASPEFEGRKTGSPGGCRARQWLVDRFTRLGLRPAGTAGFLQPFQFTDVQRRSHGTNGPPEIRDYPDAANVLAAIAGNGSSPRVIVLSAHYDHLGTIDGVLYPGADDNASGIATLLALASEFTARPPRHRLLLAAFDGEEEGLRGAEAFIQAHLAPVETIALDVNLDMVSRNDRREIFAAGASVTPWLTPLLNEVQQRARVTLRLGHDRPVRDGDGRSDWTDESDQGPFAAAGVPFLYFGVEDHRDYHRPTDTPDKIDPAFFGDVADMIVDAARTIDQRIP
jgi:Zn-dependent M28 family amino/carboxypeptidase